MRKLLRTDIYRMFRKRLFWLCVCGMEALALALIATQKTAMDYVVSLDRVIFLPMSFYGVAVAALVGLYIGDDYQGGMIRNKIVAGKARGTIYMSAQIVCWLGCLAVYLMMLITTVSIGTGLFEVNLTPGRLAGYCLLGLFTCLAYGSIFCAISMLAKSKSAAVALCMALSFAMLFLCLHTNQVLVQTEIKNGVANPAFVSGTKRVIYLLLHDINPSGQAAQLSAMNCLSVVRFCAVDLIWVCLSALVAPLAFRRIDIP